MYIVKQDQDDDMDEEEEEGDSKVGLDFQKSHL